MAGLTECEAPCTISTTVVKGEWSTVNAPLSLLFAFSSDHVTVTDQLDAPASDHFLYPLRREGLRDSFPVCRHILIPLVTDRTHLGSIRPGMLDNQPQSRLQVFEQLQRGS